MYPWIFHISSSFWYIRDSNFLFLLSKKVQKLFIKPTNILYPPQKTYNPCRYMIIGMKLHLLKKVICFRFCMHLKKIPTWWVKCFHRSRIAKLMFQKPWDPLVLYFTGVVHHGYHCTNTVLFTSSMSSRSFLSSFHEPFEVLTDHFQKYNRHYYETLLVPS